MSRMIKPFWGKKGPNKFLQVSNDGLHVRWTCGQHALTKYEKILKTDRRLSGKYFDKHIRSQYFCYHSKEKEWADVLNTHNTTIWLMKKFLRRFEKKVWKFLKSKYVSSLSQFYMALVVFCMKFFTLNDSKKLSIHFSRTFYIFKTFSGSRAIQRTLNRVFATR